MAAIQKWEHTFNVLDSIQEAHEELIELIIHTESMDNNEKQYWFDILPSMTEDQIQKLFDILDTERKKLNELEKKYEKEIQELNDKNLIDYQSEKSLEARKKLKDAESMDQKESQESADDILEDW